MAKLCDASPEAGEVCVEVRRVRVEWDGWSAVAVAQAGHARCAAVEKYGRIKVDDVWVVQYDGIAIWDEFVRGYNVEAGEAGKFVDGELNKIDVASE